MSNFIDRVDSILGSALFYIILALVGLAFWALVAGGIIYHAINQLF